MQRLFRCMQVVVLMISVVICKGSFAQGGEPVLIDALDGATGNFKVDSFATVEDAKWWDATEKARIDLTLPYSIRNIVTLKFNEESTKWVASNFTTSAAVRIIYTDKDNNTDSIDYTFTINYDSTSGIAYNSQRVFTFNDGYKVTARILSINTTFPPGVTAWDVLPHLRLENEMQIQRFYNFSCSTVPGYILSFAPSIDITGDLQFNWTKVNGATEYDFEWTFIDSIDLADGLLYGTIGSPDYSKIFDAGSTRMTVFSESTSIPLLYDRSSYIFCRVRAVQLRPGNQRIEGVWYNGVDGTFYFKGHETGFNWQSSTAFAEEGKRKSVVHYFDGSLKERQVVSKDYEINKATAAETFYDYQGRPAIQVLPTPGLNGIIKYVHDLNKSLAGGEYEKSLYDSLINPSDYCSAASPAMSSSSGANWYYSSNNGYGNIYNSHKALPVANGYAFAETRYAQDNTGRVMAQGGVGQQYQPGSGHETKYFYGKPDQQELDVLFGTEAGDKSHYQKNMVRDANGQYSVSYIDMSGRTIATALAGKPDSTVLDTLPTYNVRTITKRLNDPSTTVIDGKSMSSSTGLVVTKAGLHTFRYMLSPDSIRLANCDSIDICYDCVYNLEISISDECNNQLLPYNQRYVILDSNFTLGALDTLCNGMVGFDTTFTLSLAEGAYTISKKLSVAQSGYEYYRDSVFMKNNLCKTFEDFYQEQLELLQQQCDSLTCESCLTNLGTYNDFKANYITENAIDTTRITEYESQIQRAYDVAKADCDLLCDSLSEADATRDAMLLDMTPEFGQYANPEIPAISYQHNIFYKPSLGAPYNYQSISPRYYVDEDGKRDSIFNSNGQLVPPADLSITREEFIAQFKPSWAEALLPIHPEYCRYDKYVALRESLVWDTKFRKVDTYSEAKAKGYLNPINEGSLPFLPIVSGGRDPLYTVNNTLFNQLKSRVLNYDDIDGMKSMWGVATATSHCGEGDEDCFEEFMEIENAFDSTRVCRGDLDMAWRAFQQFYLTEKRRVIMDYLVAECPSADLIPGEYVRRFPDLEQMIADNTPASTDPADIAAGGAASINGFYASNCEAYAASWWNQLARCNFNAADSAVIMPRLIQVCKEGSDASHPLGSSTINPSSGYAFNSFDAVIEHFLDSAGRTYNANCNGYLITAPPPYERPASYASMPIWTKPDSCQCATITGLYNQYLILPFTDSSFAAYLQRTKNVTMTESDLEQLLQMCGGVSSCKYLEQPIKLPPALQCGASNSCVGCDSVNAWHDRYIDRFGNPAAPSYDDNDSLQILHNVLYGNYMNFHSGFNKTYVGYLQFRDSCGVYDSAGATCDSLKAVLNDFRNYYYHTPVPAPGYNADGCDTTTWNFVSFGSMNNGWVKYSHLFNNGVMHAPDSLYTHAAGSSWEDSAAVKNFNFHYAPGICNVNNRFDLEFRLKYNRYQIPGPVDGLILYVPLEMVNPADNTIAYIYVLRASAGGIYFAGLGPDPTYTTTQLQEDISDWKKISVRIIDNNIKVYINDEFRFERPYTGTVKRLANFAVIPSYTDLFVDYCRVFNGSGTIILNEDFTYACDSFAIPNPAYDCNKLPCDTAFTKYYNDHKGTTYSTSQLQALFVTHCGREAKPCQPYDDAPTICSDGEIFHEINVPDEGPCSDTAQLAYVLATEQYNIYKDSLRNAFDSIYSAKCMQAYQFEDFTVEAPQSEFHYTLYYYDRAGNLVKTVPPAGVDQTKFGWMSSWSDSVTAARGSNQTLLPLHQLVTNYRFNTLNQPVAQHSPDGGSSAFWYDRLGRIAFSQNARQQPGDWYSYTVYDTIGRINEVGEFHLVTGPPKITDTLARTPSVLHLLNQRRQITNTYYDLPYAGFAGLSEPLVAKNLRTRVAYSTITEGTNPALYDQASFYSYDIHGNVDTLLQDYRTGAMNAVGHRFKKMVWEYDLISGKVNRVAYQPGKTDQFYHRYLYDSENRLTQVLTSTDSITWERDAMYSYLMNGPLARTQLGQQKVQGVDYAYTLQGWLKAINGDGTGLEMGLDGTPSSPNQYVARDAYGVILHYNRNDYTNILSTCYCISGPASALGSTFRDLYNGNITGMSVNIPKINYPVANPAVYLGTMYYNYKYDQLNRIKAMDAYTNFLGASQSWNAITALDDYKERVSYDANGNILKYLRRGTTLNSKPLNMDSLSYKYYAGSNQLRQVRDSVNAANYTEDIDDQSDTSNYVYDAIGNLIKDKAEGIDSITWNVYGKIMSIRKSSGLNIWYTYDAGGNRISKKVKNGSDSTYTWYARDASGKVLSVYRIKNDTTYQDELHLYGSSRIGMIRPERNLILAKQYGDTSGTLSLLGGWRGNVYRRGQKFFELANHLGNVLVTISDKKLGLDTDNDSTVNYYMADVMTANDYYPFGMLMPGRRFSLSDVYRYGFNGKENDNEVKGEGNQQDYGMRIYDPRLGKFLSVDPITAKYPELTSYQFASNVPIESVDLDGLERASTATFAYMQARSKLRVLNGVAVEHRTSCHVQWSDIRAQVEEDWYNILSKLDRENYQLLPERSTIWSAPIFGGPRRLEVESELYYKIVTDRRYSKEYQTYANAPNQTVDGLKLVPNVVVVNDAGYVEGPALYNVKLENLKGGTIPVGGIKGVPIPSLAQRAAALSTKTGKNTISIKTSGGKILHFDLKGAPHRGIPTPHVQRSTININPKTGQIFANKDRKWVQPLTESDLRLITNYLKKQP